MISKPAVRTVDRIANVSRQEFVEKYLKPQLPVVLTDVATSWPAMNRWNLKYLEEKYANHNVLVEYYPTGERYGAYTYRDMTVGEYIRRVTGEPDQRKSYYLADTRLDTTLPESVGDIGIPDVILDRQGHRPVVFIGCDTFSAAHYHRNRIQAFLCQIQGSKKVNLYPAAHTKYLYPHAWYKLRTNFSQIPMEFENHDSATDEFPDFEKAETWQCVVEPGEMLFIPDHWMHSTAGYGENITLTHFWNEPSRYCYFPGLIRDGASSINKFAMVSAARVSKAMGIHRPLISIAAKLGVVPTSEREALIEHLENFGVQSPATVNAAQATNESGM